MRGDDADARDLQLQLQSIRAQYDSYVQAVKREAEAHINAAEVKAKAKMMAYANQTKMALAFVESKRVEWDLEGKMDADATRKVTTLAAIFNKDTMPALNVEDLDMTDRLIDEIAWKTPAPSDVWHTCDTPRLRSPGRRRACNCYLVQLANQFQFLSRGPARAPTRGHRT